MRTDNSRRSSNIEDRRGMTPARGGAGMKLGIGGTLLALVAAWFLGIDPRTLMGALQVAQQLPGAATTAPAQEVAAGTPQDAAGDWMAAVLGDTEDTWGQIFASGGAQYVPPTLVLFDDAVNSGCGSATAGAGPFYCPADQKIYIDLDFYRELETQFQAPGDFARAYVLAHEVGHHVQTVLGTSREVRTGAQHRDTPQPAASHDGAAGRLLCRHLGAPREPLAPDPRERRCRRSARRGRGRRRRHDPAPHAGPGRARIVHAWLGDAARRVVPPRPRQRQHAGL